MENCLTSETTCRTPVSIHSGSNGSNVIEIQPPDQQDIDFEDRIVEDPASPQQQQQQQIPERLPIRLIETTTATRRGPPKMKRQLTLKERTCQGSVFFLAGTILLTILATVLLVEALTSRYWEILIYDAEKVVEIVNTSSLDWSTMFNDESSSSSKSWKNGGSSVGSSKTSLSIQWLFEERVFLVSYDRGEEEKEKPELLYLFPLHSGLWVSCIDLNGGCNTLAVVLFFTRGSV